MEDRNSSKLERYITKRRTELCEQAQGNEELLNEIEENKDYIVHLLVDSFVRERGIPRIKSLKIDELSETIRSKLVSKGFKGINQEFMHDFYVEQLEEILCSFIIFVKSRALYEDVFAPELSDELTDLLSKNNFKFDPTIIEDFTVALKDKFKSFEKQIDSVKNNSLISGAYSEFYQGIRGNIFAQLQQRSLEIPYDSEAIRRFATEVGLINNDILMAMPGIKAETIHNLIDMDEVFDKLEKGTITPKEKKHIFPLDYTERYLYYYKNGEPEKAKKILAHITPQNIVELFKQNKLDFQTMQTICLEMVNSGIRASKVKDALRNLIFFEEGKKISNFTAIQILSLVKANLLPDDYLMDAYLTQVEILEREEREEPSSKLYSKNYELIEDKDLKECFTASKLLSHYFKPKQPTLDKAVFFYHKYILRDLSERDYSEFEKELLLKNSLLTPEERSKFEKELLSDDRLTPKDIIILYEEYQLISREKFIELKESNTDIQDAFYEYIKSLKSTNLRRIFGELEYGGITEDELIEIFDDEYYTMLREGISNACISLNCLSKVEMLDANMIIEEYNKSVEGKETFNKEDEDFCFRDIMFIYLSNNNLIEISHITKLIEEHKDPIFNVDDFNLSKLMYTSIISLQELYKEYDVTIDMTAKIRELYLNGLLSFDELAKLTEEGIISPEDSQRINKEFCDNEMISKLKAAKLGGSIEAEATGRTKTDNTRKVVREDEKVPTKKSLVSQQTDVMLEILKQYGYAPITTETNAYGYSEIQTFKSGNFEDYMVLLSEEIPEVAILMHSKHVKNTDVYYQTGGNATYILSTAKLKVYLEQMGVLESKYSHLKMTKQSMKTDDPYLRTANVTKNWGRNVPRKIHEVLHMLEQPALEEHSVTDKDKKSESILPENLSDQERQERLDSIEMFNDELKKLKEQIENDENHGI